MDDTTISAVRNDHPGCQGSQMRFQALHVAITPVTLSTNQTELVGMQIRLDSGSFGVAISNAIRIHFE